MPGYRHRSWDFDSSGDYVVKAFHSRKETEIKVGGAKLPIKINGKQTSVWIESESPTSVFIIGELWRTLVSSGVKLSELKPEDNDFRDYSNNQLHLLRKIIVVLETSRWVVEAKIKVIGGSRPSIVGMNLMSSLALQLIQKSPWENVMSI